MQSPSLRPVSLSKTGQLAYNWPVSNLPSTEENLVIQDVMTLRRALQREISQTIPTPCRKRCWLRAAVWYLTPLARPGGQGL